MFVPAWMPNSNSSAIFSETNLDRAGIKAQAQFNESSL